MLFQSRAMAMKKGEKIYKHIMSWGQNTHSLLWFCLKESRKYSLVEYLFVYRCIV